MMDRSLYKNPIVPLIIGALLVIIFLYAKGCITDWKNKQDAKHITEDKKKDSLLKRAGEVIERQIIVNEIRKELGIKEADEATTYRKEIEYKREKERPAEIRKVEERIIKINTSNNNDELRILHDELMNVTQ